VQGGHRRQDPKNLLPNPGTSYPKVITTGTLGREPGALDNFRSLFSISALPGHWSCLLPASGGRRGKRPGRTDIPGATATYYPKSVGSRPICAPNIAVAARLKSENHRSPARRMTESWNDRPLYIPPTFLNHHIASHSRISHNVSQIRFVRSHKSVQPGDATEKAGNKLARDRARMSRLSNRVQRLQQVQRP
jgi:hypothetical protein